MLTRALLRKYSGVLRVLGLVRGVPYVWNESLQEMRMGGRRHILQWLVGFIHSWIHVGFLTGRLVLNFSRISKVHTAFHCVWIIGSVFNATMQLNLLLRADETLGFLNLLVNESKAVSDRLLKRVSSRVEVKREERLLELILFMFAAGATTSPAVVMGVFLVQPNLTQFLYSALPGHFQEYSIALGLCTAYEVTWFLLAWAQLTFFNFIEFVYFFLAQTQLKSYRSELTLTYGTKRWVVEYRKLQLFQNRFNECIGPLVLPFKTLIILLASQLGNYGTLAFFDIRQDIQLPTYLIFPLLAAIACAYESVVYPWMGSLHSLSTSPVIRTRRVMRNPTGFKRDVCRAYGRSLDPLRVKLGPFKCITRFSTVSVFSFTIISTARLTILFPHTR